MQKFGIGQSVRRTEDVRFVTGTGAYTDDLNIDGQAHGFVLRSPFGHAKINSIDVSAAQAAPGVVAVFTGADVAADGLGTLPCVAPIPNADGSAIVMPPRPVLQSDRVRYVGDPVAFIIAESINLAKDAAELIKIDYADLPAVGTIETAEADGAPLVWDDAPGNVCLEWAMGDEAATEAAFASAKHVSRIDLVHNRVVVNAMETRQPSAITTPRMSNTLCAHRRRAPTACRALSAAWCCKLTPQNCGSSPLMWVAASA